MILTSFLAGCSNYSKEQLQEIERIKLKVTQDPGSINAQQPNGSTFLHDAVMNEFRPLLAWLLDRGADANVKDRRGYTPLHEAVITDDTRGYQITKALIKHGADVNSTDSYGETPLHSAASFVEKDVVKILLSLGADVNRRANRGETPLHYVSRVNPDSVKPRNFEQIDIEETIKLLLAHHADINSRDSNGATPIHSAIIAGNNATVTFLLAHGADINAANIHGFSPLHVAAIFGQTDIVRLLVYKNADVNARDGQGQTPLYHALHSPAMSYSRNGKKVVNTAEVVEVLRQNGAIE